MGASNSREQLREAAHAGRVDLVEKIIAGAKAKGHLDLASDPCANAEGTTPVHLAASGGHVEVLSLLLSVGGSHSLPTCRGATPLHAAVEAGKEQCIRLLVQSGADVNAANDEAEVPALIACALGNDGCLRELLDCKADPGMQRGSDGCAPVHIASKHGNIACIQALLEGAPEGFDINLTMVGETTALFLACSYRRADVALLLLAHGADASRASSTGQTPLFAASHSGCAEVIGPLIKSGSDVSTPEQGGCTPLVAAARAGHADCVSELLRHGADANNLWNGMTALEHARKQMATHLRCRECVAALGGDVERSTGTRSNTRVVCVEPSVEMKAS